MINNTIMEEYLWKADNLPILENLIVQTTNELEGIPKIKRERWLRKSESFDLQSRVRSEVNDLLGIETELSPEYSILNFIRHLDKGALLGLGAGALMLSVYLYQVFAEGNNGMLIPAIPFLLVEVSASLGLYSKCPAGEFNPNTMELKTRRRAKHMMQPILAHEWAHVLQNPSDELYPDHSHFYEGHAQGVMVAHSREHPEGLRFALEYKKRNLCNSYGALCNKLGVEPNETIAKLMTRAQRKCKKPSAHDIGYAVFSIIENEQGSGVYTRALQEDFSLS
jgi:hypothetical protein